MMSAKDVALVKALATMKMTPAVAKELKSSPAVLKELRRAIVERVARQPTLLVGRRSPEGSVSSNRSLHQREGRRGAAGLADSVGSSEPAVKRPAPDVGSAELPASTPRATGEQAASGGRQLVSLEGGATYAVVAAATAKWAAHAHSQWFGPVRTRHLPRDGTKAHVP